MSTSESIAADWESEVAGTAFDRFRRRSAALWSRYVRHPWFEGIGRGGLSDARFLHFVAHDRPYIQEFQQAQVRTAARFGDLATWLPAFQLIADEADLEDELLTGLPSGPVVPDRWGACLAREGYMNHLHLATTVGDSAEAVASLLPCGSGFGEITQWLGEFDASGHPRHLRTWLGFYCTEQQQEYSRLLVDLLEIARREARSTEDEQYRVFHRSLQHQVRVLDAAWDLDDGW